MSRTLTLGVIQAAYGSDMAANITKTVDMVRAAAAQGAQVILPSELFQGPYFCVTQEEKWFATAHPWREHPCVKALAPLAAELGVAIPISIYERDGPHYYNSLVMADGDGALLGVYRKSHIPDGPGYQEKYYFRPGDTGFKVWETRFGRIGTGICWDQWYPEAARAMALQGAEVLLYPTAIGSEPHDASLDTRDPWRRVMQGHAVANVIPVAAANRIGLEPGPGAGSAGQSFYGSSFLADHRGDLVAALDREEEGVLTACFDLDFLHTHRAAWGFFRDRRTDLYEAIGRSGCSGGDRAWMSKPAAEATQQRPRRLAALDLIEAGLARRGGLDEALGRPPFSLMTAQERAFARGLAATTVRRLGTIDRLLGERLQKPPPEPVRALLRLGVAQLLYRDTPAFAAVASTVAWRRRRQEDPAVQGADQCGAAPGRRRRRPRPAARNRPARLAVGALANRLWEDAARAVAREVAEEAATDLTPKDPAESEAIASALDGEALAGGTVRTRRRGELPDWPGFAEGRWWVQDAAAAVPARLLAVAPGETALDLCAAPGGKTLQLAAAGARVTALDRSGPRLRRLHENLARTGLEAEVVVAAAEGWADPRTFDAVLLDAPCTATGTFRRHPDVLWGARPGDVAKLAAVQARLLDAAAERVRPGGRLVYCVCSLEPEEGEAQAAGFLKRRPDTPWRPWSRGRAARRPEALTPEGALRILPSMGGRDGFYIARFARAG